MQRFEPWKDRREVPFHDFAWWSDDSRPSTPLEALMQCAPNETPQVSVVELLSVKEALADAFEALTSEEIWVFNALVIERLSLRKLARQIGTSKTTIARIRDRATRKLRDAAGSDPRVIAFLNKDSSDD